LDKKLHDAIVDWRNWLPKIMDSIALKCQSPNIIMCLLAIDGLNGVMPKKLLNDASEAEIKKANTALKNAIKGEVQLGDDEAINRPKYSTSLKASNILLAPRPQGAVLKQDLTGLYP